MLGYTTSAKLVGFYVLKMATRRSARIQRAKGVAIIDDAAEPKPNLSAELELVSTTI